MRVLFIRSNPVDPDSRVEKEVNCLLKAGFEVEILAWDRSAEYKINDSYLSLPNGKVRIHRFGIIASFGGGIKNNLVPLVKFQIGLFKWLSKHKGQYDIIHACDFDTANTASIFAKLHKKIFIYDIFDYYIDAFRVPNILKKLIEKRDHKIINSADAVIICSDKRKEQIIKTTPKKLTVIHNSPPKINFNEKKYYFDLEDSKIKIVYVGILAGGRFIKEIADIVKDNPNYEFHIGGFGKLENYFKKMSSMYNNIFFYGKLPYEKTLELENSCDIMTAIYDPSVTNHNYAAPNKFYEALMLGKPIIMAKNTGMDEIININKVGEVIDYNIKSFELAIKNLIERKSEWEMISKKMKILYEESYSWDEMEKRLLNLYGNFK